MPIRPLPDRCAIIIPYNVGEGGGNCDQPPTVQAVWRFNTPGPLRILLCDEHSSELAGDERLTLIIGYSAE